MCKPNASEKEPEKRGKCPGHGLPGQTAFRSFCPPNTCASLTECTPVLVSV